MEFLFIALMEEKKSEGKFVCYPSSFSILPLSSRKAVKEAPTNFPQKNKGFINYVFCRNWAGTRLDSSTLVNKQVGLRYVWLQLYSLAYLLPTYCGAAPASV